MNYFSKLFFILFIAFKCNFILSAASPFTFARNDFQEFDFSPFNLSNRLEIDLGTAFGSGEVKGLISKINGNIDFCFQRPEKSMGTLLMDSNSMRFGYAKIDQDAQRQPWLDSIQFPNISFQLKSLENFHWKNEVLQANATGTLSFKKNKISLSVPVAIHYKRAERRKYDGKRGDLLFIRGNFPLSRTELSINPSDSIASISDKIVIDLHLMAGSNQVRPLLPCRTFGVYP